MRSFSTWGLVALGLLLHACAGAPPPHQRALEANELCAQYIGQNNLQTAEDQCDLGLQFSPQYADLWVNKGNIAFLRGQYPNAKEHYIKALRLNPDQAQAYSNLGNIYMKEQKYGTAADNFRAALRVNPDYLEARYNLALAYVALKKVDDAKKEFRTLIQIYPNLSDPWAQLGVLAIEDGDYTGAIEDLEKATQLDPKFSAAWAQLGNARMENGQPCEAKDSFSSCLENDENNVECRNNILVATKKCSLAEAVEKEKTEGPQDAAGEYSQALQLKEDGRLNDAERALKRCLRKDAKFALCHFAMFELFKDRSDTRNAKIACKNYLKFANTAEANAENVRMCETYVSD